MRDFSSAWAAKRALEEAAASVKPVLKDAPKPLSTPPKVSRPTTSISRRSEAAYQEQRAGERAMYGSDSIVPEDTSPNAGVPPDTGQQSMGFDPDTLVGGLPYGSGRFTPSDLRRGYKRVK
jgi:hypothetical protein